MGGHDRGGKAELRVVVADPHDARRDATRPVVHREPRSVGNRLELLERHLEPVRPGERTRGDERVAAANLRALDARQADRHAVTGGRPLDRGVMHLDGACAHVAA